MLLFYLLVIILRLLSLKFEHILQILNILSILLLNSTYFLLNIFNFILHLIQFLLNLLLIFLYFLRFLNFFFNFNKFSYILFFLSLNLLFQRHHFLLNIHNALLLHFQFNISPTESIYILIVHLILLNQLIKYILQIPNILFRSNLHRGYYLLKLS